VNAPDLPYLGEAVSLVTAVCWSATAVFFSRAARRVGAPAVNLARLTLALGAMLLLHTVLYGRPFPSEAAPGRIAWLAASGLIGFSLGDALLYEAYVILGPRLAMLIMTLWPVLAALMAWAVLGQAMGAAKVISMLVTLGGIALVVAEKGREGKDQRPPRRFALGLLLALGGALGQAVGFIFSKFGMGGGLGPISANLVRVCAGFLALGTWQALRGELVPNARRLRAGSTAWLILFGAFFGPVLGVVLSLYAIQHATYLGVASTLMSLSPVILLPVSVLLDKEKVSLRAVAGTLISIGGATALFLL
jgi:drug/metabolite transporter (DMT)-like permease